MREVEEVVVLADAAVDLDLGKCFYDNQGVGIGNYFIDTLLADIESLRLYAGIHQKHFGYYRAFSKRFPYAIYYDLNKEIVQVVAVLDMRRDPDHIRKSLERMG